MSTTGPWIDRPPQSAVPWSVIEAALSGLDRQAKALREAGSPNQARLVEHVRSDLEARAAASAPDLAVTSVPDAADRLGVAERTVVRWIKRGILEGRKMGGEWLAFERSIRERQVGGRPAA